MFLHIMVGQNPKKSNAKKIKKFYFISWDVRVYLCQKKTSQCTKKCKYIKKKIEMIFTFNENFNIH